MLNRLDVQKKQSGKGTLTDERKRDCQAGDLHIQWGVVELHVFFIGHVRTGEKEGSTGVVIV